MASIDWFGVSKTRSIGDPILDGSDRLQSVQSPPLYATRRWAIIVGDWLLLRRVVDLAPDSCSAVWSLPQGAAANKSRTTAVPRSTSVSVETPRGLLDGRQPSAADRTLAKLRRESLTATPPRATLSDLSPKVWTPRQPLMGRGVPRRETGFSGYSMSSRLRPFSTLGPRRRYRSIWPAFPLVSAVFDFQSVTSISYNKLSKYQQFFQTILGSNYLKGLGFRKYFHARAETVRNSRRPASAQPRRDCVVSPSRSRLNSMPLDFLDRSHKASSMGSLVLDEAERTLRIMSRRGLSSEAAAASLALALGRVCELHSLDLDDALNAARRSHAASHRARVSMPSA